MLQTWDPERIFERIPLVLACVGARRCGKSTALSHLTYLAYNKFELVIACVGSAACSPVLEAMMERHPLWDSRMFFSKWSQPFIDKLLTQQQDLKKRGIERQVLIIMDDVILTSKDEDQLAHMCLRGRHFNISVMCCAVSYTNICKRARRALDFLMVYSCPMQGDRKILSWEYASNSSTADFALSKLEENQCVVFETSRKQQKLFNWRAQWLHPEDFRKPTLPVLSKSGISASRAKFLARRRGCRRRKIASSSDHTQSLEPPASHEETQSHGGGPQTDIPKSEDADPQEVQACSESTRTECADESTVGGR